MSLSRRSDVSLIVRFMAAILIVILVAFISVLSREGLAHIYDQQTTGYLSFWKQQFLKEQQTDTSSLLKVNEDQLNKAVSGGVRTVKQSPENPRFLGQLAGVYDVQNGKGAEQAVILYRQLIRKKPAWPYYRANLALAKARVGELDREFEIALEQAVLTGPWEKDVLERVATLGFVYQDWLNPRTNTLISKNLKRWVTLYTWDALKAAAQYGEITKACSFLLESEKYSLCHVNQR